LALGWYTSLTTRNLSCTSFPSRVSSASFLWFPSVTPALSSTTCATHFLALPATADSVLAMDAGCGSSTRGLWDVVRHVMKLKGLQRATRHGERFHVTSMHLHVWAMLSSALVVLYRFRWVLPAVHRGYELWAEYAAP
jgi:hypothetical protein